MFDKIPFIITTERQTTLPDGRVISINMRVPTEEQVLAPETEESIRLISEVNPFEETQFNLDGYIRTIPMFPISEEIKAHCCYLQSFGWAFSGPEYFTRRKDASSYLIQYTYEGEGIMEFMGNTYRTRKGEGVFIDCRLPHYYRSNGTDWQHLDLHINGPMILPVYQEYIRSGSALFKEPLSGILQSYLEQIASIHALAVPFRIYQESNVLYSIAVHLLTLHATTAGDAGGITSNIQYLIHYMEKHYMEDLSLDFLSRFSGISKYYLTREFRKYTGFPPNEYLIRLRISNAQFLLSRTNESIQQIGEMVGIGNPQHFAKLFRRITGVSPREYRSESGRRIR